MDLRWNDTLFGEAGKVLGQGAIANAKDSKSAKDSKKEEKPTQRDSSSGIVRNSSAFNHHNPIINTAANHGPAQFAGVEKSNMDSIIERARRKAAEKTAEALGKEIKPG
ncbi:MAG: hypothetical protein WCX69_03430 [Candidatus Paceibacterota bacterium]